MNEKEPIKVSADGEPKGGVEPSVTVDWSAVPKVDTDTEKRQRLSAWRKNLLGIAAYVKGQQDARKKPQKVKAKKKNRAANKRARSARKANR